MAVSAPGPQTAFAGDDLTEDPFLGGRLRLVQPKQGYRAATDPVFLAAAVAAGAGERVLDLGCGAGAALLCLGARVDGLELHGLDVQPDYLALARQNGDLNGIALTLHGGDVATMPGALRQLAFDHVMMNPPYHRPGDAPSPVAGRAIAHREGGAVLADWIGAGIARLRPKGWLTLIHRAERLPEILRALDGPAGAIAVKPLVARADRDAGRVVVQARKGARAPFRLFAPLILHEGPEHLRDGDDFSAEATAILRGGGALNMDGG